MLWKNVVLRLRALLFRSQMDEELQEELNFHLEMEAEKNRQRDLDAVEARRQARLRFGSLVGVTEECRNQRGISTIEIFVKDLRYGIRMLRKSPAFTVVAVLTLALSIGANAVVFGAINGLILHPLKVPEEESLYAVWRANSTASESYPDYLDLRDRNRSFDGLAAFNMSQAGLDTGEGP